MSFKHKNIDDAKNELVSYLSEIKNKAKSISTHIQNARKDIEREEKAIPIKVPSEEKHTLLRTYIFMVQHIIDSIESNTLIDDHDQLLVKVADLSKTLAQQCEKEQELFVLFDNARNMVRNIAGILLGDKYVGFNQMSVPAYHITYDFKTRDRTKITDKEFVETFIKKIVTELKMKILHGPTMMEGVESNPGITGFAVVDFSHIAIHTFLLPHNLENEVFMDIFSCKTYDKDKVIDIINESFNVEEKKVNLEVLSFGE